MERVESADGTTIAYERHGSDDGPVVVCLHGTGVTRHIWRALGGQLEGAGLVVPDRRGRGESGDTEPWSFERELEDAEALFEAASGETTEGVVLFGSSFGGLVSLRTAERVDPAGLVCYEPPMPREVLDQSHESLADRIDDRLASGDRAAAVRLFFEEATGAENVEAWPIWPDCIELAATISREARVVEEFELGSPDISAPTLLFEGAYSPTYLQHGIDLLERRLPEPRVVEVEAAHAGVATAPGAVAASLREFLDSITSNR